MNSFKTDNNWILNDKSGLSLGTEFGLVCGICAGHVKATMIVDFKKRWLKQFGIPSTNWRKIAQKHLNDLPFAEPSAIMALLTTLFDKVPQLIKDRQDPKTLQIAEAFAWCCYSIWQCGSAFPSFPENYAEYLCSELFKMDRQPEADLIAGMLVADIKVGRGQCGFNKLILADPQAVRDSERRIHEGQFEFYLNAQEKYDEYLCYLQEQPEFKAEWAAIKTAFPKQTNKPDILHRTLLQERNWERGPGAQFDTLPSRFQSVFDLFCWKYFLWGMRGDEPLLMKPSVVFTPLGTSIFIPGYLSFDAKRDLNFSAINKIHKARGIRRQGTGFSESRQKFISMEKRAKALNAEALRLGFRGDDRYQFITEKLGLASTGDYRQIRKLLQKSNKSKID